MTSDAATALIAERFSTAQVGAEVAGRRSVAEGEPLVVTVPK